MTARRWLLAALAVVIAAALLAYALQDVDYGEIARILARLDAPSISGLLMLVAIVLWLRATRWVRILKPIREFTPRQVAPALLIGFAGNNLLPARLGELLRALIAARELGFPFSAAVSSLLLERLLDMSAVLILYVLALALADDEIGVLGMTVWPAGLACAALLVAIWALLEKPHRVPGWWHAIARPLPERIRSAGEQAVVDAVRALGSVRSPSAVMLMLGNSLTQWALAAIMIWLTLHALDQPASLALAIVVLTATVFAAMLPSAPGYLGAMQAAFVLVLTPFGISREMAVASSVVYTLAQWVPITAIGLWLMLVPSTPSSPPRWTLLTQRLAREQRHERAATSE